MYVDRIPKKLPEYNWPFHFISRIVFTQSDRSFSCSLSRTSRNTIVFINKNTPSYETALLDVKIRKEMELIDRLFYSLHSGELLFEK